MTPRCTSTRRTPDLWIARAHADSALTVPDATHVHVFVAAGDAMLDGNERLATGDAARLTEAGSRDADDRTGRRRGRHLGHCMTNGRMPALFVGHGNPLNALQQNEYTEAWQALAESLPRPKAILAVSAHWYVPGGRVTADEQPRTIHDFGGFPQELFDVQYPAPGSPDLAARTPRPARSRRHRDGPGLGARSRHLVDPGAPVPGRGRPGGPARHRRDAHRRAALRARDPAPAARDEDVLILGSGNIVHNLHTYSWGRHPVDPYDWAVDFETAVREHVDADDPGPVIGYETELPGGELAAPTPDHFLPLLYTLAQRHDDDTVAWKVGGFDGGSISMLALQLG